MSGIGFKSSVDLKNGEGFCGRPKEEEFREQPEMHRHCYNDGFTGVYELAQKYGFTGTEQEFLASLKGVKGDGVYVDHIDQSDEAGEVSTIWFTDGSSMRLINGIPGAKGERGDRGEQGPQGLQGPQGDPGQNGLDGYSPVKGVDYFTSADKQEMVSAVLASLPLYDGSVTVE